MNRFGALLLPLALSASAVENKPGATAPTPTPSPTVKKGSLQIPPSLLLEAAKYKNVRIGALGGLQALRTKLDQSEKTRIDAKNMTVRARLAGLLATPPPPSCPTPTIQAVLSDSPVSPGEEIVLNGCGFGAARPHVRLIGQFPNGFLELEIVPPWKDHVLVARVPAASGVLDQPARLSVLRNDLTIGNEVPLGFRASRSLYWLTKDDVALGCARPGYCGPVSIPAGSVEGTTGAVHEVDQPSPWIQVDTVSVHLVNGWTLYDYGYSTEDGLSHSDFAYATPPTGFVDGASTATIRVVSTLIGRSAIRWSLFLFAVGPSGVAWR